MTNIQKSHYHQITVSKKRVFILYEKSTGWLKVWKEEGSCADFIHRELKVCCISHHMNLYNSPLMDPPSLGSFEHPCDNHSPELHAQVIPVIMKIPKCHG